MAGSTKISLLTELQNVSIRPVHDFDFFGGQGHGPTATPATSDVNSRRPQRLRTQPAKQSPNQQISITTTNEFDNQSEGEDDIS